MTEQRLLFHPDTFESLGAQLEEEIKVNDALSQTVHGLNQAVAAVQSRISKIHSTPRSGYPALLLHIGEGIRSEIAIIGDLNSLASQHPYYKYNQKWDRPIQAAIFTVLVCAWLGGMGTDSTPGQIGRLLTLEEVGAVFNVPTNVKDRDTFHITIEEYLFAAANLASELTRLAVNSTTMGDFGLPIFIGDFVRDLFTGFQLLNLKNDGLRKRVDGVKYDLKRVEDVVYDLSIRKLVSAPGGGEPSA